MLKDKFVILALAVSGLVMAPSISFASEQLFIDNKCNKCHAISAIGIQKAGGEEDEDKAGPPDLSDVGTYTDAAYLKAYLNKEVGTKHKDGTTDDKKHKVKFKGSDEDLTKLANWLAGMKKAPK